MFLVKWNWWGEICHRYWLTSTVANSMECESNTTRGIFSHWHLHTIYNRKQWPHRWAGWGWNRGRWHQQKFFWGETVSVWANSRMEQWCLRARVTGFLPVMDQKLCSAFCQQCTMKGLCFFFCFFFAECVGFLYNWKHRVIPHHQTAGPACRLPREWQNLNFPLSTSDSCGCYALFCSHLCKLIMPPRRVQI